MLCMYYSTKKAAESSVEAIILRNSKRKAPNWVLLVLSRADKNTS